MTPTKEQIQVLLDKGITPDQIKKYSQGQLTDQKQGYSGIGSSVSNFSKDIAQGGYLAFAGGQKKINELSKQYLTNGDKLFQLAQKQTDKEKKKSLLLQAQSMYNDAERVGSDILGQVRSNKQVIGDALGTLGWMVSAGTPTSKIGGLIPTLGKATSTVGSRLLMGTAVGAGAGAQSALNEDKSGSQIAKATIGGGILGLGIGGIAEGIGLGLRKIAQSKTAKNFVGNVYNRELQPETQDLVKSLEMHSQDMGKQVANSVDEFGKPIYKGGYDAMAKQAENQITKNATILKNNLGEYANTQVDRTIFKKDLISKLDDVFGALDKNQVKIVQSELDKLPEKMSLTDLLKMRQTIDSKIPKGFWIDANPQRAFIGNVRYYLRGLMKQAIEDFAPTTAVKQLNQKIGLAMDVKDLSYLQEALRMKGRGTSSVGLWKYFSTILDRTLFSPSVTTRVAQGIKNLGQQKGSIIGRNIITKGSTK